VPTKVEKDTITGTDTTGHEWDGIKELDTPLPRWWLIVFYATIVWTIGYWIAMSTSSIAVTLNALRLRGGILWRS